MSSDNNFLLKYVSNGCWILVLVYVLTALTARFGASSVKFQRIIQFLGIKVDWVPDQSAVLLSQPKFSQALEKKFALFTFDPKKVKVEQIQKAVNDKGFEAGKPQEGKQ